MVVHFDRKILGVSNLFAELEAQKKTFEQESVLNEAWECIRDGFMRNGFKRREPKLG